MFVLHCFHCLPVSEGAGVGGVVGVGVGGCGRSPCWHRAKQGMVSASVASQLMSDQPGG